MAQILILVLPFLVMWWFLIRPQRQRMAEHREFMANVGEGDDIVTASGIYGTVVDSDAESLYVEIADGVEIRLSRGAVGEIIEIDEDEDEDPLHEELVDLDTGLDDTGLDDAGLDGDDDAPIDGEDEQ
ncbi:MAG: preprotein translocase subunit YajC [Actinomycetia bacterium]|nr:preprotein translocase subunit YajC [Actinomycetes bacterium]MCP4086770.1 preprotein translocase subunit YajC [Actinomycetes bacterium]